MRKGSQARAKQWYVTNRRCGPACTEAHARMWACWLHLQPAQAYILTCPAPNNFLCLILPHPFLSTHLQQALQEQAQPAHPDAPPLPLVQPEAKLENGCSSEALACSNRSRSPVRTATCGKASQQTDQLTCGPSWPPPRPRQKPPSRLRHHGRRHSTRTAHQHHGPHGPQARTCKRATGS